MIQEVIYFSILYNKYIIISVRYMFSSAGINRTPVFNLIHFL